MRARTPNGLKAEQFSECEPQRAQSLRRTQSEQESPDRGPRTFVHRPVSSAVKTPWTVGRVGLRPTGRDVFSGGSYPRITRLQGVPCSRNTVCRKVRTRAGINVPRWPSRRPAGEARGGVILDVLRRRATKPAGMDRQPDRYGNSCSGPYRLRRRKAARPMSASATRPGPRRAWPPRWH